MINWGTFMMEVSKTPSVLIGLVFTAITICLTIFNLWWSMRNRVEAEWTVSVTSTADVMIDPIPVAQVQAAGSRILKSNTTMVVIVTNSGDGPAFSVTAEGINMKGIVVNEYDFPGQQFKQLVVQQKINRVMPGERFLVVLDMMSIVSSCDFGVKVLWTPQPTRLGRVVYKEYPVMRDPSKGSRHIHTTTRPLLRWSSLFSHMPRPFRRLLQFAHWIRHDAMMDVPSFLKKLDDMLPADDYSPNAGVDEGADHADDRADPND